VANLWLAELNTVPMLSMHAPHEVWSNEILQNETEHPAEFLFPGLPQICQCWRKSFFSKYLSGLCRYDSSGCFISRKSGFPWMDSGKRGKDVIE
jgi:hypothetical protein